MAAVKMKEKISAAFPLFAEIFGVAGLIARLKPQI